jgi:hypothetical protein
MRALLMLCDHVAVAEGKFYINGGAWTMTGPQPSAQGIAILLWVPWHEANRKIDVSLQLLNEDGSPVNVPGPVGPMVPLQVDAQFEVGRPAGVREGSELPIPIPVNVGPLPLTPGSRYVWQLTVNGETHEDWRASFDVRAMPAPFGPATPGPAV